MMQMQHALEDPGRVADRARRPSAFKHEREQYAKDKAESEQQDAEDAEKKLAAKKS